MTYREALEQALERGYAIVATNGYTETIEQHLEDMNGADGEDVVLGETESGVILVPLGAESALLYTQEQYTQWCQKQGLDAAREMARMGL